jgi:hypothetical protein
MKTNYKKLLLILLLVGPMVFSQQTVVLIDFGSLGAIPATNLNYNTVESTEVDTEIANLIDNTGTSTGFVYKVTDRFNGLNVFGTQTPSGDAVDSYYGDTGNFGGIEPTGAFTLSGLDNSKFYSFEVFASRMSVSDNRETLYTITGSTTATGTLNAGNNEANTVLINNIQPSGGVITFKAEEGPNNNNSLGFYYLGALKMTETDQVLAIEEAILEANGLNVYPNPVGDELNIDYKLSNESVSEISVFDITGRLVYNAKNSKNQVGTYSFKWSRLDNNGGRLAAGTYFLKLQTETKAFSKKLILK